MQKTVVVGLSGGVDSFVTALLLQKQGYRVIGVHLILWEESDTCELIALCKQLGVEFVTYDGRELFRQKVIRPFIDAYTSGKTPSPCTVCNPEVKFTLLRQLADEWGVEKIATGHYIRIFRNQEFYYVRKGIDPVKDQSYFLWKLQPDLLSRLLVPLGDYTKTDVKKMALENGYKSLADKKESMGVCFLRGTDYCTFIAAYSNASSFLKAGPIITSGGEVVGEHSGIAGYTIGQKKGIPKSRQEDLYVSAIQVENNCIIVDRKSGLWKNEFILEHLNVINRADLCAGDIQVKVRGLGLNPEGNARFHFQDADRLTVVTDSPVWALAPGQPVVFYQGDIVLGGGVV